MSKLQPKIPRPTSGSLGIAKRKVALSGLFGYHIVGMGVLRRYTIRIHMLASASLLIWLLVLRQMITGRPGYEMFLVVPFTLVFIVVQILAYYLLKSRLRVMKATIAGKLDVILLWLVYISTFLYGFFTPYFGDGYYWYNESYNRSVAMMVFGTLTKNQSYDVMGVMVWISVASMVVALAVLAYERVTKHVC